MKTLTAVIALALASCAEIPLPGGSTGKATLGYYVPSEPTDPDAKLGLFIERVSEVTPITPTK